MRKLNKISNGVKILAIETSCDETAVSVLECRGSVRHSVSNILSSVVSSQVKLHAEWGGVVPSLAKREHQINLVPVLKKALKESNLLISKFEFLISKQIQNSKIQKIKEILEREDVLLKKLIPFLKKYEKPKIDLIAVVNGPGLEPALWVGVNFAKALALAWNKPLVPVNHMEGHLFSVFLKNGKENLQSSIFNFQFPAVALLVSGGHTQLVLVKDWLKYEILGETRDDAAGEAFDKVAKMLNLGYPGGPVIAACAAKFPISPSTSLGAGNFQFPIKLPRPMINSKDYDFSFSGLKTAVLYKLKNLKNLKENTPIVCKEFQQAVIDVLISKTMRAAKEYKAKTIILGGGVAANKELRRRFQKVADKCSGEYVLNLLLPEIKFTGDNAAMAALAAYFRYLINPSTTLGANKKSLDKLGTLKAEGNLRIT